MSDSRLEKFIYAICSMDVSDLPVPLSRIEKLWNCLITGETPDFEPLSRNEKYLMAMLDRYDISNLPAPMSRGEKLLYKIAVGETDLSDVPGYLSRYEELLKYLIENGGISGGDFEYVLYTLNQSLYTLYTTAEKPVKSAILKGLTLVNLSENLNTITNRLDYWYTDELLMDNIEKLKRNTYYTVLYRLENLNGNHENYNGNEVGIGEVGYEKNIPPTDIQTELDKNGGWCKIKFQLTDSFMSEYSTYKHLYVRPIRRSTTPVESETIEYTVRGFAILEGDYMTNPIPFNEVFEGMQSVKMPVLKTLNNIVDFSNEKLEFEYGVYFGQKGDGSDWVNNKGIVSSFVYTLNYIELLPNQTRLSTYGNDTIVDRVVWFDENKNQLGSKVGANNSTLSIPTGAKYFRFLLSDSRFTEGKELAKDNIGHYNFYYGGENQIFNNEPHKTNILTVNEDVTLRSNGDICDELNLLTGQLTQRIGEDGVVLSQEVVKTVDLTVVDQDNQPTKLGTFENLTHVLLEAENLIPEVEMEVATNLLEDTVFNLTNTFNTLYPTAAKPVVDGTLYGNTLVNLLNKLTVNAEAGQTKNWYSGSYATGTVKSGKYILLYNVKETSETNRNTPRIRLAGDKYLYHGYDNFNTTTGIKKWIFTADTDLLEFSYWVSGNTGKVVVEDFILLEYQEGMENWNIPYFEGMQSVQAPSVTMTGKNLINRQTMNGGYIDASGIFQSNNTDLASDFIRISPNTNYTYKVFTNKTYDMRFTFFDENKSMIERTDSFRISHGRYKTYRSPSGAYYVRTHSNEFSNIGFDADISLVMGDTPLSSYEPHKSITLSTPADLTLRKVGEVQDEVNVMTGEVVERIGEFILNGSEYWDIVNDTFRTTVIKDKVIKLETQADRDKIVISCDRYPSRTYNDPWSGVSSNFISLTVGKVIVINDRNFTDIKDFKNYLSQNPLTIKFVLATPTTKTVDLTVVNQDGNETKLRTFDDTTHVLLQSEVGPNPGASLTVRTKIPSASSTSLLMDDISTEQQQLESTVDEQSNNVDAIMMATTEIYEETL